MSEAEAENDVEVSPLEGPFALAGPRAERQAAAFLLAVATTNKPLLRICDDPKLPQLVTFYRWARTNDQFHDALSYARQVRAEMYMDEAVELIDRVDEDHQFGGNRLTKAKLQMQVRQAWAARLSRDWMPRTAHEHTGREGEPIETRNLSDLSDEELRVLRKVARRQGA